MDGPQGSTFNPAITTLRPVEPTSEPVTGTEFGDFENLTGKLVNTPKADHDEKRQEDE